VSQLPLPRTSTVDALVAALRPRILDGELPPGQRLREQELSDDYGVARHTLRAALKQLATEGLVRIEPNRGARVAELDDESLTGLADLRIALETEAARLALDKNDGLLPDDVHDSARHLAALCRRRRPQWSAINDAHEELHAAIVAAADSPRIEQAHQALAAEMRLFIAQLRPKWSLDKMASDHLKLVDAIERRGPDVLRPHIRESTAALLSLEA
jgi:DNA-binding GntR family transcriptional regulator